MSENLFTTNITRQVPKAKIIGDINFRTRKPNFHLGYDFVMRVFMSVVSVAVSLYEKFLFHISVFFRPRKVKQFEEESNDRSDSEKTHYESAVAKILSSERRFKNFRRNIIYQQILEHVDYDLGEKYLLSGISMNPEFSRLLQNVKSNDDIGNPKCYYYKNVGWVSPTTIRYLHVAQHIEDLFGSGKFRHIVEIGAGYGGQAAIFSKTQKFDLYSIYDLPTVQTLIERYLELQQVSNVQFLDYDESPPLSVDFVISNYAFSELPIQVQLKYVEMVLKPSRSGYMIMNSGRNNRTWRSAGKLSIENLMELIPTSEVLEEEPCTGPDNYVLIWGKNSSNGSNVTSESFVRR